ncbi:MAG: cytochrome c biogenesis protein CcsA [Parvularculaceae bacterium]
MTSAWARRVRPWCWRRGAFSRSVSRWEAGGRITSWLGGWRFWDPVENASFMPWLIGTALLHSALVVERRQTMISLDVIPALSPSR